MDICGTPSSAVREPENENLITENQYENNVKGKLCDLSQLRDASSLLSLSMGHSEANFTVQKWLSRIIQDEFRDDIRAAKETTIKRKVHRARRRLRGADFDNDSDDTDSELEAELLLAQKLQRRQKRKLKLRTRSQKSEAENAQTKNITYFRPVFRPLSDERRDFSEFQAATLSSSGTQRLYLTSNKRRFYSTSTGCIWKLKIDTKVSY